MLEKKQQLAKASCCFRMFLRAENETRTRDPDLGKVVLYQLSYFRFCTSTEGGT